MADRTISPEVLLLFRKELKKYAVFNDMEWDIFTEYLTFSSLKKKENFVTEGSICDYIGFVCAGSVRYYAFKDGVDITGYFSFENEFVSSYRSFLTRQPSLTNIEALERTDLILISWKNMQTMLVHPLLSYKMERFGRLVAEHYCCCYEERIASFVSQTPEERYLKLMETNRGILQRIPQHYIANFLGITPVSLSRIRRRVLLTY